MSTSAFFIISSIFFYSDSMTAKFCKQSLFLRILGKSRKYMQLHFLCLVQDQLVFLFPFLQKLDSESRYPFSADRHSEGRARSPNKSAFSRGQHPRRNIRRMLQFGPNSDQSRIMHISEDSKMPQIALFFGRHVYF